MAAPGEDDAHTPEPPRPINWNLLTAEEAQVEWLELNAWINWLRHTYGLSVGIIPPLWHRHPELIWELSALRQHWLSAYDPKQHGSAPIGWHRDFADAEQRLHDWVAACGTRLDSDRPTRQVAWPGEDPAPTVEESAITNRDEDFVQFIRDDIARRRTPSTSSSRWIARPCGSHGREYRSSVARDRDTIPDQKQCAFCRTPATISAVSRIAM